VLVSATALFVVAVLQYRWTAQVSEAREVRIGRDLQSRMMDWHLDLYREFAAICVALQVGPDSGAQDGWNAYAQRYSEWNRTSATADLVQGVYLWETSQGKKPRFLRLVAPTSRIEAQAPAPGLGTLLARLQVNSSSLPAALHAWQYGHPAGSRSQSDRLAGQRMPRSDTMTGWQFDARLPAIVHPIFHHQNPFENPRFSDLFALYRKEKSPGSRDAIDWIIVVLDRPNIEKKALPALANRYFREHGALEYKEAVISAGEGPALYSSDPDFVGPELAKADAAMNIFGPPPESTEGHFWQAVQRGSCGVAATRSRPSWQEHGAETWLSAAAFSFYWR